MRQIINAIQFNTLRNFLETFHQIVDSYLHVITEKTYRNTTWRCTVVDLESQMVKELKHATAFMRKMFKILEDEEEPIKSCRIDSNIILISED